MSSLLSLIYAKIADVRNTLYEKGFFKSFDLGARTISVGNITTGGTGKTPLVILVSQILAARGKRVCILTRGYGRKNPKNRIVVSNGKKILSDARTGGDEPVEMAKKLLGKAIVVADANRVAAAKWAKAEFGVTTFILDDGFQHRRANRDLDIVCIDATNPFGGGKMLPSGRLREPLANLGRANIIVITRSDLASNIDEIKSQIAEYAPACPIFTTSTKLSGMTLLDKFLAVPEDESELAQSSFAHQTLANAKAFAFCALGSPESFFRQLRKDNFEVAGTHAFTDHHFYRQKDIKIVVQKAKDSGAEYLLTTAKDAVKLAGVKMELPCFVVEATLVIDDADGFAALL